MTKEAANLVKFAASFYYKVLCSLKYIRETMVICCHILPNNGLFIVLFFICFQFNDSYACTLHLQIYKIKRDLSSPNNVSGE